MTAPDGLEVDVDLVMDPEIDHLVEAFDVVKGRWYALADRVVKSQGRLGT